MIESALNEVDKVEIITLADNYIDLAAGDNSQMVKRAMPLKAGELRNSILAEHGFSALLRTTTGERTRTESRLFLHGIVSRVVDGMNEKTDFTN